jgi:DNA-binding GntR family transcriptional regulator
MKNNTNVPGTLKKQIAAQILRFLVLAQQKGEPVNLETLSERLPVRRSDIRAVVTQLHQEGFLDALYMRVTLKGWALGMALLQQELPAIQRPTAKKVAAAL